MLSKEPCPEAQAAISTSALPAAADPSASPAPLSSAALLGSRRAVTIEHAGTQYVLRATRNGKLILTK